ncbi:hypothetical protein RvVAR031_pl02980 (plasmid) [Agrobacterium vitis]|nr:hypothetical protein RvVAR031_pl02980 [Agrobacterium vitis]
MVQVWVQVRLQARAPVPEQDLVLVKGLVQVPVRELHLDQMDCRRHPSE